MPRKTRILLLAVVVIFLLAIVSLVVFTTGRVPPRPPLPTPNGYEDFLKAATLLAGDVGNASALDHDNLRALLSTNAETLRLIKLGLSRVCSMPTDSAMTNIDGVLSDLAKLKSLARLLVEEGRLAEMEGRNAEATQSYIDVIRLGNEISRGGLLISRLVGIACESIGCHALAKVMPNLSREDARSVLTALEKVDAGHVTWAEVLRGEKDYVRYQLRNRFNPILWVVSWWHSRQALEKAETRHKTVVAHERLLAAELALRCYQSEQGRLTAHLDDLVTNYLSKVPQDPFTGRPLIYRPQGGTNWLVYSVGPDGVDDGGKPAGRGWPVKGDILFDSSW